MLKEIFFLFGMMILLTTEISAQRNTSAIEIVAVRSDEKIVIDGILSETVWKRPGFTELYQQEPSQGQKASLMTELWVAYDEEAIYYAARHYDSDPDSIVARLVRRDFVWGDPSDGTVLYLDPYGDRRNGYFFYVNAAGTLADGLLENDAKQTDLSWDAVWEGIPHLDSEGWSVEMKIPFSQLRFKKGDPQIWGINVERFISRRGETAMIAYTPRNENGFASRFPKLIGITGISPRTHCEFLPYLIGKAEFSGHDPDDPFNKGYRYTPGIGLDIRTGLGHSLTLNGTINPDFGQVEVDPAEVNLTDVETSFDEKRPFFTEGVNIYRFGNGGVNNNWTFNWTSPRLFYSRRIGRTPQGRLPDYDYADIPSGTHILGAAKISGKSAGDWKIGMINALTRREYAEIEKDNRRSKVEVEPFSYYGVLRLQKDFHQGLQGLGLLSTLTDRYFKESGLRDNLNRNAWVTGTDGWFFLDKERTYVISGWTAWSRVSGTQPRMISLQYGSGHYFQRPDADHISIDSTCRSLIGHSGRIMLNKNRGCIKLNTAIGWISPKFETNDLGFESYSDLINLHCLTGYQTQKPSNYYQNAGLNLGTFASYDFGGNKTWQGYYLGGYVTFANLYNGSFSFYYNPESYNARRTRGGPLTLNPVNCEYNLEINSDMRQWWVLGLGGTLSNSAHAQSQEAYAELEIKISPTLSLKMGPEISNYTYHAQWIGAYNDIIATATYGKRYIFAYLKQTILATEIRLDWIIKPTLSVQVYCQPYFVSGDYRDFKSLRQPKTYNFQNYGNDGSELTEIYSDCGKVSGYILDPDGTGPAIGQTINNPDFNFVSMRGNAVLRWEYRPGSAIYFVWTQDLQHMENTGNFNLEHSWDLISNQKPDNIFLVKMTYWL